MSVIRIPPVLNFQKLNFQEAEMLEKYSGQVTVKEILDMYDNDPESFFMDTTRKVFTFMLTFQTCRSLDACFLTLWVKHVIQSISIYYFCKVFTVR